VHERTVGAGWSYLVDLDLPAGAYLVQLRTDDAVLRETLVVQ
jgi:hypothetical protein